MSVKMVGPINTGAAAGGAGVATANASTTVPVTGVVLSVYIKYNGSPPAGTTDVIVSTVGTSPDVPSLTMLTITDAATDGYFYPRINIDSTAGASQAAAWDYMVIRDFVNVKIQGANNDDTADVWLFVEG